MFQKVHAYIVKKYPLIIFIVVGFAVIAAWLSVITGGTQASKAALLISSIAVILNAVSLGFVIEKYNQETK